MFRKVMVLCALLMSSMTASAHQTRLKTDIVETAVAAKSFETLVAAVTAADLVGTLKSAGPFTVFAPTDAAFAKLPAGTVEGLLQNIPALKNILVYHVAAGQLTPKQLVKNRQNTTLQGQNIEVRRRHGDLLVNNAKVLNVIYVKNGVIYVIDSVLLPKS